MRTANFHTGMVIRKYQASDRPACMTIFNSNMPTYFAASELADFLIWLDHQEQAAASPSPQTDYYYVLEDNQQVMACGGFHLNPETVQATLAWGMVGQAWHGQGFGRHLLAYRIQQLRLLQPAGTLLLDTTQHTYRFFQRFGFTVTQVSRDYYAQGLDRYDMVG
jgi:N-acetylglutamate synthase-like GNAT family acetyltransferase